MSNILVTGASGRLGRTLVPALLNAGHNVAAVMQNGEKEINGAQTFFAEINDRSTMYNAFNGIDTVIHLAAIVSQYKYGKKMIHRVNVDGTANIVELSKASKVKRLIFASTVDVYGVHRSDVLNEDSALKPVDAYSRSKAEAESIIVNSGIDYTIFRMSAIYGIGFERSFFKVFDSIANGKAYIIGDGNNLISMINIRDVVDAYMLALQSSRAHSRLYNLSDGSTYTQNYLYELAAKLLSTQSKPKHISKLLAFIVAKAKGFDTDELRFITSNRNIDISRARSELGFAPKVRIEDGGAELVKLYRST